MQGRNLSAIKRAYMKWVQWKEWSWTCHLSIGHAELEKLSQFPSSLEHMPQQRHLSLHGCPPSTPCLVKAMLTSDFGSVITFKGKSDLP